jgi:hypothetical protein
VLDSKLTLSVPEAGRLKQDDGSEKYVDAIIFYKKFDTPQQ